MQILITDAILEDPAYWPDLESLLDLARRNRCYVDAHNPVASSENPWLAQVDSRRQQDWLNATRWAVQDAALFRLRTMIADISADPVAKPYPKITLKEVVKLIEHPSHLWVENDRSDRRFWLSMMPTDQRATFEAWEQNRIFQFDSRGGLGELRKALEELHSRGSLDPRTSRALFDSDGEVPGHRSADAVAMVTFCEGKELKYHCLVRRAIENYIPKKALWAWADSNKKTASRTEHEG